MCGGPLENLKPGHSPHSHLESLLEEGHFAVTAELFPSDSAD